MMAWRVALMLALPVYIFGQANDRTKIGQHHIGETLAEWYGHEPDANRQAKPETSEIGAHQVGETFTQWLEFNSLDLADICRKHHEQDGHNTDFKALCKRLSGLRDTGSGDFYTIDQTGRTLGWRFSGGNMTDYSVSGAWHGAASTPTSSDPNIKVTKNDGREYTWKFADGKVSEVGITPDWSAIFAKYSEEGVALHPEIVPVFQEEVDFLTQIYGKPARITAVPYGNAYGAHWERAEIIWNAPDGTQIIAFERSGFNQSGQLLLVTFLSKESRERTQQTKPNPYK
jgi:hypothetical protein